CLTRKIITSLVAFLVTDLFDGLFFQRNDTFKLFYESFVVAAWNSRNIAKLSIDQTLDLRLDVLAVKDVATDFVNHFTVTVDDVVVLNNIFTRIVVVAFNALLC